MIWLKTLPSSNGMSDCLCQRAEAVTVATRNQERASPDKNLHRIPDQAAVLTVEDS